MLLERQFSLNKIKDDDSAILFYTGFPTYKALISFYNFIEPKLGKMQYWKGQHSTKESQSYQEDNHRKKPGPSRKLTFLDEFLLVLPAFSLIRDFSNQNAYGNVSKISVNHTDDIPYMEMFHFTVSGANFSKVKSFFEVLFTLASNLFVCGWIQDVARLLRVGREKDSEYLPR